MNWHDLAYCRDYPPEWWFPAPSETPRAALAVCRGCPVSTPCLDTALAHGDVGIWAGTTSTQRARMRRQRERRSA